jgi:predicted  nucleic acid-binding Zn-ribbon protein
MKQEVNVDVYRVALESAKTELDEISESYEKLRVRKEGIEKLVLALRPIVDPEQAGSSSEAKDLLSEPVQQATDTQLGAEEPQGLLEDPFQRRIDHVLGIGAGIRDVRNYTRQF